MRVLLISNMYAYPGNWDKLDELGRWVELGVVMPSAWHTVELHPVQSVPAKSEGAPWTQYRIDTHFQFQGNPFRYVYSPGPLAAAIEAFRPDLVHVEQEPESLSLLQLSLLKRRYGYKLLFVAWENIHPLHQGAIFRLLNYAAADAGIVGNREAAVRARRMGFRKRLELIPQYGFAAAERQPTPERRPFTVGYAGRLVAEKGIHTLLEAARQLPDVRVRVAGDGPLSELLRREPQFELLGTLPRGEMGPFWRSIDVLAVPSLTTPRWAEQFGRVICEAMAAGVPVIGSSSGSIPEVIGEGGLVFPEGDAKALAEAFRRLRDRPEERAALAALGHARVRRCYSYDAVMGQTVAFYEEVLQAAQAAAVRAI
jgi:glycosyltransferase involved in cell wall biosynthesis